MKMMTANRCYVVEATNTPIHARSAPIVPKRVFTERESLRREIGIRLMLEKIQGSRSGAPW